MGRRRPRPRHAVPEPGRLCDSAAVATGHSDAAGTAPPILDVRGPAFYSEDFGLLKRVTAGGGSTFEFRADFINVLNRSGVGNLDTNLSSTTFGGSQSLASARGGSTLAAGDVLSWGSAPRLVARGGASPLRLLAGAPCAPRPLCVVHCE